MKKIFKILLWAIIFNASAIAVKAQNNSSCYMLDENGNSINLGHLCQNSNSSNNRNSYRDPYEQPRSKKKAGVHTIPIKGRRSGIPVIDVKFNNKYTFEMMLDTGASGIVITQQMARKLKVNHTETVWVSTPSSNSFPMLAGYVYSVGVGKLTQKNNHVITSLSMDMGLLGQSFFGRYDITIKQDVVEFRER